MGSCQKSGDKDLIKRYTEDVIQMRYAERLYETIDTNLRELASAQKKLEYPNQGEK